MGRNSYIEGECVMPKKKSAVKRRAEELWGAAGQAAQGGGVFTARARRRDRHLAQDAGPL